MYGGSARRFAPECHSRAEEAVRVAIEMQFRIHRIHIFPLFLWFFLHACFLLLSNTLIHLASIHNIAINFFLLAVLRGKIHVHHDTYLYIYMYLCMRTRTYGWHGFVLFTVCQDKHLYVYICMYINFKFINSPVFLSLRLMNLFGVMETRERQMIFSFTSGYYIFNSFELQLWNLENKSHITKFLTTIQFVNVSSINVRCLVLEVCEDGTVGPVSSLRESVIQVEVFVFSKTTNTFLSILILFHKSSSLMYYQHFSLSRKIIFTQLP